MIHSEVRLWAIVSQPTDDRHDDPDLSHVQPETGDSEVCDENDESGLPKPQEYDRTYFDVFDYLSDEYADARNLNEAIEIRGQKAFAQSVTPMISTMPRRTI